MFSGYFVPVLYNQCKGINQTRAKMEGTDVGEEDGRGCIRLSLEEFDGIVADWNELQKKQIRL